jgi:Xaa-Pro aminopeptidase
MAVKDRVNTCLAALAEEKLDLLLGFTGEIHNFLQCEPVFTLTGFKPIDCSVVIMTADGSRTLIVTPSWDAARAAEIAPDVRVVASDDLIGSLKEELRPLNAPAPRIGVAGTDLLPVALALPALATAGAEAKRVDRIVRWAGRRKNPDEIESARRATEIAEKGYEHLLKIVRPGMREYELSAELFCHMKSLGSEDNFLLMSSSTHNLAVRAPRRRVMVEGDIILVELTPCVDGQFSQICRTAVIGEPSAIVREKYKMLQEATEIGLAAARPGATVADAANAMDDVFRAAGYGEYCRPPYMRVRGHGLGALSDLPGDVTVDNKTVLETDMIFMLHPNQYLPETGYLMCGEPVRIGSARAEPLTARPSMLDTIAV